MTYETAKIIILILGVYALVATALVTALAWEVSFLKEALWFSKYRTGSRRVEIESKLMEMERSEGARKAHQVLRILWSTLADHTLYGYYPPEVRDYMLKEGLIDSNDRLEGKA